MKLKTILSALVFSSCSMIFIANMPAHAQNAQWDAQCVADTVGNDADSASKSEAQKYCDCMTNVGNSNDHRPVGEIAADAPKSAEACANQAGLTLK